MLVTKGEMGRLLGVTRKTFDEWCRRYADDMPVVERGTNGAAYKFDADAVLDFFRARKADEEAKRAERDEQLAQLLLPMPAEPRAANVVSLDDRLKTERLNALRMSNAAKARDLVSIAEMRELLALFFADMGRGLTRAVRSMCREHGFPEPITDAVERRFDEFRRDQVARMDAELAGVPPGELISRSLLGELLPE